MIKNTDTVDQSISSNTFNPHNFAELFQHLRLREQLSVLRLSQIVSYSIHSIIANETTMRNPTIKTMIRYIQKLDLELIITKDGITIRDPKTGEIVLSNWTILFE